MLARLALIGLLATTTLSLAAQQPPPNAEDAAQKAAESWLALVDGEEYGESWTQAASTFKKLIASAQWTDAVTKARMPFGAFQSRSINSRQYSTSLPGAPPGQYVMLTFDSHFEKRAAVETIVMTLDVDGTWRTAGAFIR
jgi:hypothetical protein